MLLAASPENEEHLHDRPGWVTPSPMNPSRRRFLADAASSTAALAVGAALPGCSSTVNRVPSTVNRPWTPPPIPADLPKDVRIVRAAFVTVAGKRPKFVGKNARLDDHGDHTGDHILRLWTNSGIAAFGTVHNVKEDAVRPLLGKSIAELVDPQNIFSDLHRPIDIALWDLLGKVAGRPAWRLLGGDFPTSGLQDSPTSRLPVYDGSLYFADPLRPGKGADAVAEEIEPAMNRGHRAFKLKIGRGQKWLTPWETGFKRDVEVIRACRKAAGKDATIMVDANNGYVTDDGKPSLERVTALLDAVGDQQLTFIEEMFPEDVESYRHLSTVLRQHGLRTVIADGENMGRLEDPDPYLPGALIKHLQPDIRGWGLSLWWRLAKKANIHHVLCTPHNWGSHLGHLVSLQLGRGIPNFGLAEQDTSECDLFETEGWILKHGRYSVPDRPGLGIGIRENVYAKEYAGKEDWHISV